MTDLCWNMDNVNMTIEYNSDDTKIYTIRPHENISKENLLTLLQQVYDTESQEDFNGIVYLRLRGLSTELLTDAFKYSLSREDLKDPLMILNIINLIKIYNTLDDSFFENENIYVTSLEDLLDLKLEINSELKKFIRQVSIYFVSLFKSYNKTSYSPLDNHIKLPSIYEKIFLSSDLLTLSGILSVSPEFSSNDCIYIDEALLYISTIMGKNMMAMGMLNSFLEGLSNGNCSE